MIVAGKLQEHVGIYCVYGKDLLVASYGEGYHVARLNMWANFGLSLIKPLMLSWGPYPHDLI